MNKNTLLLLFFNRTPNAIKEFPVVVHDFFRHLTSLKVALHTRNMDEIKSTANKLLQMGDDILEVVTAYMDFVHPICLDIQRHGIFNEEKMAELKSKLNDKLLENKKILLKEFDVLTNPRQTEE